MRWGVLPADHVLTNTSSSPHRTRSRKRPRCPRRRPQARHPRAPPAPTKPLTRPAPRALTQQSTREGRGRAVRCGAVRCGPTRAPYPQLHLLPSCPRAASPGKSPSNATKRPQGRARRRRHGGRADHPRRARPVPATAAGPRAPCRPPVAPATCSGGRRARTCESATSSRRTSSSTALHRRRPRPGNHFAYLFQLDMGDLS